jgi:hypothetical protein
VISFFWKQGGLLDLPHGSRARRTRGSNPTHISAIRTGNDLLEAIVFPSASFARGFLSRTQVITRDGKFTRVSRRSGEARLKRILPGQQR